MIKFSVDQIFHEIKGSRRKDRWFTAFFVPHDKRCFIFTDKGDLHSARLSATGDELLDKAHLRDPDMALGARKVIWSHPAFANRCIFVRSNSEMIAFSLAATEDKAPLIGSP